MSSTINGKEYQLRTIFSKEFDYHIPPYQRPYSWEESQTETLFDNLYDTYSENPTDAYFLGSIVLIKEDNNANAEVVDGQQRLTTLTILLAVIASKLDGDIKKSCINYIMEAGNEIEGIKEKPRLSLRDKDQVFFKYYIQDLNLDELLNTDSATLETEAQQHIRNNCEIFYSKINNKFGDNADEILKFCQFVAMNCYIVAVSASDRDAAFKIFSVMNSTGLDLTASDILKSEIIGKISNNNQQDYTEKWEDLEVNITRQGFTDLLSHIRMIFIKKKQKESILNEYRNIILGKYTSEEFIDNIITPYAEAYSLIRECKNPPQNNNDELKENLSWLNKIEFSDWIPCTIKFITEFKNNTDYIKLFIKKIERLSAYLYITGKDINERIERFCQVLFELENKKTNINNPLQSIELTESEKQEFIERISGEVYKMSSKRRNYLILRLDSFVSDGGAIYNPKILTIEHVLPQTVNPASSWATIWSDENARAYWLNKIANLVPLTRRKNSEALNYDFDVKKEKYFKSSKGTTSYALTTQVLSENIWDENTVVKRQSSLLKVLKDNWELKRINI